ncbi:pilus assembly FimT family protein [Ottowia thiooxydans]|uniref:pilus assembly FimT family protein n=1 Tax=Ottowia thiooxydans TaxID=219182 RepID=UPI000415775E|nr:prepilin-type N-terminal cleavage/methylation domain-containing protein [Ottowia thiooxydans]
MAGDSRLSCDGHTPRGFTLIELMLVMAVIAIGTAVASLAMRDSTADALARDGERLAALLESARSRSRAAGVPVRWQPTADGFVFQGLPPGSDPLPTRWLDSQTRAIGNAPLLLGPDPLIGSQSVLIHRAGTSQPLVSISTDGLRPFTAASVSP